MIDSPPDNQPPLLRKWCVKISIALACLAWVEFVVFGIVAWMKVGHDLFFLLMIAAWPIAYGFVWFVGIGMAQIHSGGPASRRHSALFREFMPRFYFAIVDYTYPFMANLPLILFPVLAAFFGGMMVCLAVVGKIHM